MRGICGQLNIMLSDNLAIVENSVCIYVLCGGGIRHEFNLK